MELSRPVIFFFTWRRRIGRLLVLAGGVAAATVLIRHPEDRNVRDETGTA